MSLISQVYKNARNNQSDLKTIQFAIYSNIYSELSILNISDAVIKMTVGREGCNFIKKTETNNLYSIWCNKERNVIEFWGNDPYKRQIAMSQILNNILYNQNKLKMQSNHLR